MNLDCKLSGAWITVNRACNFRCLWCYGSGTKFQPTSDMSESTAEEILHLVANLGMTHVLLIGGEPTLWPHIHKAVKLASELALETVLITNGYRLADKRFVDDLQSSGLTAVNLSMKAENPSKHAELTRTKTSMFGTVLKGIRNLADSGIPFEVTTIANTLVMSNLADMCKVAVDNGAEQFSIDFCSVSFENGEPSPVYMPDFAEVICEIVRQYPIIDTLTGGKFHLSQNLPTCLWPSDFLAELEAKEQVKYGCHVMAKEGLVFDSIGQLLICNHLHDFPLGQLGHEFTDALSFKEFWQSSEVMGYYDQINAYPAQRCIDCNTYTKCGGGCPLLWFVYNPEKVITKGGETT